MQDKNENRNTSTMNFKKIYEIYLIQKGSDKKRISKNLKRWLKAYIEKNGISAQTYYDMNEIQQMEFIAFEIKDKMLEETDKSKHKEILKNIEDYKKECVYSAKKWLEYRNEWIYNIYDRPIVSDEDKYGQKKEYEKFCNIWKSTVGPLPPSFKSFMTKIDESNDQSKSSNPNQRLSIYDQIMSYKNDHQEDYEYFEFEKSTLDSTIQSIVLKVLKDLVGLEIDYDAIEECIDNLYKLQHSVPEGFEWDFFSDFPTDVNEYVKRVTWKPIKTYKKNGQKVKPVPIERENVRQTREPPYIIVDEETNDLILKITPPESDFKFIPTDEEDEELLKKEHLHTIRSTSEDADGQEIEVTTTFVKDDKYTEEDIDKIKKEFNTYLLFMTKNIYYQMKLNELIDLYTVDKTKMEILTKLIKQK